MNTFPRTLLLALFVFFGPFTAYAQTADAPFFTFFAAYHPGFYDPTINGSSQLRTQIALKDGDQTMFTVRVRGDVATMQVTADLSALGLSSTTPLQDVFAGFPNEHQYQSAFLFVDSNGTTDTVSIPITATDGANNSTTQHYLIALDNTPPVFSISDIHFSEGIPPKEGDLLYVSGHTTNPEPLVRIISIRESLFPPDGVTDLGGWNYTGSGEGWALNTSDGTHFTDVPVILRETFFEKIAEASLFKLELEVSDGAGNRATTSKTIPVPHLSSAPSVLFIPGLKGSFLKTGSDTLWPPTVWSDDIAQLALTTSGMSVNPVVVDGILNTFYGTSIYSGFASYMNGLVQSGTTTAWKALPYDWRYSPEKILADGIQTPGGTIDPVAEIESLAAQSGTGKVVIVAHSMGGLLGKALIKKLEEEGKANLIESFIMVGTPQLGTPQAITALLHGADEGIAGGIVVNRIDIRQVAQNMPGTYALLPSPQYFNPVFDPVIVFDVNAAFTEPWWIHWGTFINEYLGFAEFITGNGVARIDPRPIDLPIPEILRADLVENAKILHEGLDTYTFPESIRVVQIAGWGLPTAKAVRYRTRHSTPSYEPLFTREGDGTVVYPSAISALADETYFFNIFDYNDLPSPDVEHRNLLDAAPIKDLVLSVLHKAALFETSVMKKTKPLVSDIREQLVISTHSPVILGAYDEQGHFSGVNPNQNLEADVLAITEDIPGSTFLSTGDSQYLFLPKTGSYTLTFKGIGTGPTTVDIDDFSGDITTPISSYSDIPVTASTSATFFVNSATPQDAHIQIDSNGDGQVDGYAAPDTQSLTLGELLTNLKTAIQNLTIKEKLKTNLLKKVENIEKKIAKQKNKKATKVVMNLEKQITKKAGKGKMSDAEAQEILNLLTNIENAL